MTPGIFAGLVADQLGLEIETVAVIQRHLRENGYTKSHGHGRGATHVHLDEAAALLVAVCAKSSGSTLLEAGSLTREKHGEQVRRVANKIRWGDEVICERTMGGMTVSVKISAAAVLAIRDEASLLLTTETAQ